MPGCLTFSENACVRGRGSLRSGGSCGFQANRCRCAGAGFVECGLTVFVQSRMWPSVRMMPTPSPVTLPISKHCFEKRRAATAGCVLRLDPRCRFPMIYAPRRSRHNTRRIDGTDGVTQRIIWSVSPAHPKPLLMTRFLSRNCWLAPNRSFYSPWTQRFARQ